MPTLNHDFSAVAMNPSDDAATQRSRRIVGLSLGATLITVIVLFAAMAFAPDASAANTCTLTSTSPITLWGDVTKWSGCGGTYPGQGAGDTAIVSLGGGYTLKVDAFNNPVVLQISGSASSIPIQVASGGTLTLQTSSTATSNNTFTVDSGGTMGTNSGANITGFQGGVHVNGGTFNSAGTIQLTAGTFTYSGGSLTGSGTISITNSAIFDGAVGSMPVSGTTINSSGFLSYTSASNAVTLSSGASINITAGTFSVASDAAINGTATEAINIASGGTMLKTSGTGLNVISPFVKNDGTINVSGAGAGGGFGLSGNGTHSGSFVTGSSSQTIAFGGNNSFNSGAAFSGATPIKFAAGTQTFNAAVTASGGIKWAGGTIAGTGPLTVAGTSFLDGSNSAMILTGVINNTGTMTYSPTVITNLLTINGASAKLETTGGPFTIAGDYDIQAVPSGAGTLKISGGTGSVTKSAGGTGSSILAFVDVSGGTLTNTATGPLNLAGGGQSTGTLSVPLNTSTLNFTNGTFTSSGGFSGSGTINVAGGTLNINTATSFGSGSPNFNINLGTLGGSGTVSLLGASTWSGGTVTGSAPFNVSSTGVLTLTGGLGAMTLDGRVLSDQSSVIYNSSTNNLTLKNGASILNSGTFTATGSGMIDTDGSAVTISNNGTFTKTAAGLFVIKPTFNNAVNGVSVTGGVLAIDADGTSSASWTMSPGTEVWFPAPFATTYTWGSGTTFSGGKVTIDGSGNVATSTPLTLTSTNVEMNGGTFTTNAAFTISSPASFKWTDGTLAGAGHTIITSGTTFDMLSEFGPRAMTTHVIDNAGNATMSALTQPINVNSSSTFNNTGTLDIQSDGSMNTDGAGINTFNNTGLVKKSAGGSGFRFDVKYTQSAGTTDANSPTAGSTIIFNGGGTLSGGALQATSSTNFVDFFNATFNLNGGTLNNGQPGALRMTGSTAVVSVNIAASATNFIQNFGTLQGIANLTIPSGGTYTWNGGSMSGTGQFVIASGGTLDVAGGTAQSLSIFSKTISNSGTITYHPLSGLQGNQLTLSGTASIANQSSANINITDNSAFLQSGGATTIVNSGNFLASGNSSVAPTMTNNASGLIKANGGMLTLMAGTSTGTLDAVSPGAINFGSGSTFTITGGTWGNSGGGFWVTGGTVTINAPFSLSGLALNSGQIDGSATLTLTGSNAWGGGTMAGSGTTANSGTLTMSNNSNSFLDTRTFNNTGTVTYQNGGSSLQLKNGAVFNNSNAFNFQGDVGLTCNCATPPLFHNIGTGTITKPAGTGSAVVSAPFTNDGNVAANLGQFVFTAGGAHTGAFSAAANANITFTTGSTFSGTSSLTGAGEITFNGGTSTIGSSTVTPAIFTVNGANVTLNSAATIGTLNVHNAAVLGGTGTIHLTANSPVSEWTGGTINGSGTITVNPGAIFLLDGLTAAMTLDTRPIVNNGILTYISTTNGLILANSAVITNTTGSTLNLDAVPGIGVSGINNAISNAGLMQRGTTGSIGISPAVTNTGSINANLGTLAFNGGLTQTIGSTNLLGGSISSPTTIALAGGTLTSNGTVAAAVNNTNGIVAPGNPSTAGTLTITGAYAQGVNGGMSLKIGGTSNYDIVDATASGVTLGGTLTVSLFNAFTPASGNTFDVLKFSTRSGDFANYFLPTFGGGGSFQNAYVSGTPNVLRLTAVVTASDLMIGQTAPASVLHGQNGTWTLTVTNGPTPVTNVVVTDTFANASFVSATSVGPCTPSGSTVTCNLGSLAANQSVNVSLILNAPNLVTISNNASVTATEFDPNTANNNTGNAFTPVLPSANLSITNTASGNPVNAGSPLSFSIVVANAGPDTSSTVSVSNTFPAGVTSFTFSGAGWSCGPLSGSTATCSIASIPGSSAAPTLLLSMTAPASGPATDSATVSASTADPNGGNNSASQTITITGQADLSITKSGPASVIAGQNAVYTITVTNNGPSSATSVTVTDPAPAGLTFVSNSGGCTGNFPCALGTLTNGQSVTITSTYSTSPGGGGVTVNNIATVASTTADPNSGNNSGSAVTTINSSADLAITKSGPPFSTAGSPIVYTITVTNNGPSDAAAVTVADATPAGTTFVSNAGACTSTFPCALGTMTAGQTKTITTTFTTAPSFAGSSVSNSATVSSTTSDPNAANNTATAVTSFSAATADLSIAKSGPTSATTGSIITYTLTVTNAGPATAANVVVSDPTPAGLTFFNSGGACSGAFPCNLGAMTANQSVTITASYTVTATSGSVINSASVSGTTTDPNPGNDSAAATTTIGAATCNAQPPSLTAPANGSTISSPVTFSWTAVAGATSYKVFASIGGATTQDIGTTTGTSIIFPIAGGSVVWSVQALGVDNCNQLVSASGTFTVCAANTAPTLSVVGTSSAGQSYTVQWTDTGVGTYELQEANNDAFLNPITFQVSGTSRAFTKNTATATAFFYRVRSLSACNQGPGPYSIAQRVVIVPVAPISDQSPSATVDINNKHVVVQTVFIPGQGSALPFIASTDEPWLTVTPSNGILPAAGLTLSVSADPADLPNGTFTATIILTFPGAPAKVGSLDAKPAVTVPVSISVVTPVSPTNLSTPNANSLIIPSVGHLDGINSQWRSDVRITNTSIQKLNYLLRFTPAGGDPNAIKQTQVSISSNDTMALDDIVKNWYGVGALGDAANGVLEIRPLNTSGKGTPNAEDVNISTVTIASSRTFNQSAGGTLGQYIPAIPFANFVGKVTGDARAGILSLQQIAQSPAYRTNLGIVEAAGKATSVLVSVFDASGKNILDIPIDLKAGEQQQLNSFLAAKNITLSDGRVEVKVTGGDGKVTAYASVVDNKTTDPLLVNGVPLVQTPARTFVLPGVADISNGIANWRTDMRVFNAGTDPQYVTLTLYPLAGGATSDTTIARSFTINPGEVSVLDNVLAARFGVTNIGGAMHVDTLADANLVVTGRTYNQVDGGGTYGQYIAAVTPADAVGKGGRTLNVLQVEDSTRYRTNLGIAEVSGKPATVEVSVFLPDAKVAPKVTIPLAANEYRQFRVLQQLGVGTAYNARISIKVTDGDGKITAYGSVIDMQTQDPTYVPAQ
jgi:uncharacterized repeat protein (TIGR01451 family)